MRDKKYLLYRFISTNVSSYRIQLFRFNIFLAVIYFSNFILDLLLLKNFNSIFLGLSIAFLILGLSISLYKFNRVFISLSRDFTIIVVTLITAFYGLLYSKQTGFFLYFFYVLLVLPYVVNFKTEEKRFFFYLFFTSILFIASFYCNLFDIFDIDEQLVTNKLDERTTNILFFENFLWGILLSIYYIISIINTQNQIHFIELRKKNKRKKIDQLLDHNEKLQGLVYNSTLKEEHLVELRSLIENKNLLFMPKFKTYFPSFVEQLHELNISEIEICALTKLRLDTKGIAQFYNCSVRSVDNKKYRIRKKLNIPNGEKFDHYVNNL